MDTIINSAFHFYFRILTDASENNFNPIKSNESAQQRGKRLKDFHNDGYTASALSTTHGQHQNSQNVPLASHENPAGALPPLAAQHPSTLQESTSFIRNISSTFNLKPQLSEPEQSEGAGGKMKSTRMQYRQSIPQSSLDQFASSSYRMPNDVIGVTGLPYPGGLTFNPFSMNINSDAVSFNQASMTFNTVQQPLMFIPPSQHYHMNYPQNVQPQYQRCPTVQKPQHLPQHPAAQQKSTILQKSKSDKSWRMPGAFGFMTACAPHQRAEVRDIETNSHKRSHLIRDILEMTEPHVDNEVSIKPSAKRQRFSIEDILSNDTRFP